MGMRAGGDKEDDARRLPAYKRFIAALRFMIFGPLIAALGTALLAGVGVRGIILAYCFMLAFGSMAIGVVLGWASVFQLAAYQKREKFNDKHYRAPSASLGIQITIRDAFFVFSRKSNTATRPWFTAPVEFEAWARRTFSKWNAVTIAATILVILLAAFAAWKSR